MSKPITLTHESFDNEVLNSKVPVLVDFWADWCGPCRTLGPVIEEVSDEYEGRLKVGKLNVDENSQVAGNHGIRSIPTLIIFKEGKPVDKIIGVLPKEHLKEFVNRNLN